MASATKSAAAQAAARWRAGTEHYLEKFSPVAKKIHEKARSMPHNSPEDAQAIVEMAISETQEFARQYHDSEDD